MSIESSEASRFGAPISVVIPTLNAAAGLGPTLAALVPGVVAGLIREVVVSDGGSGDGVGEIADAVGARFVAGPPGRGGQLRRGAETARGAWLWFLHADTVPPLDWPERVARHIDACASEGRDRAAVFRLAFDDPSRAARVVAGWANARSRWFALPFGDQSLLISRAHYAQVGGYPDIPIMEDVALVRAIGRDRLTLLSAAVTTSADRYRRDGWLNRGARNWICLLRYLAGDSPERIEKSYR